MGRHLCGLFAMRKKLFCIATMVTWVGIVSPAFSQYSGFVYSGGGYTYIAPPGSTDVTRKGINSSGQIVGSYYDVSNFTDIHGFLYSAGTYSTIAPSGSPNSTADSINDLGQIVGTSYSNSVFGNPSGYLYSGGSYTPIGALGNTEIGTTGSGPSINTSGQIIGSSGGATFLYSGGGYTTITTGSNTRLESINASGQIVGFVGDQGFLYSAGSYTPINPPGSVATVPLSINASGQIVGFYNNGTCCEGFCTAAGPTRRSISPAFLFQCHQRFRPGRRRF
jgi:hypothetical protein